MSLAHSQDAVQDAVQPAWHFRDYLTATVFLPGIVEGQPNGLFGFRINGVLGQQAFSLDANGNWQGQLPLLQGNNLVAVEYLEVAGYNKEELDEHNNRTRRPVAFETRRGLPWNPATFQIWPKSSEVAGEATAAHAQGSAPIQVLDAAGNSALEGWVLQAQADADMTVSLGVTDLAEMLGLQEECCAWPPVQLKIGDNPPIMLEPQGDGGIHQGQFNVPAGQHGAPVELTIGCTDEAPTAYTQCWVFSGVLHIMQPLQVVDAVTGNVIDGADFVIWRLRRGVDGIQPIRWHAGAYGQENPVSSDAQGHVFINLPDGRYGLTVRHPDYQPRRVGPVTAAFFNGGTVQLFPLPTEPPTHEVIYTESGFSTGLLEVSPGALVLFQNSSLGNFEIQDFMSAVSSASTVEPSGLLPPGGSFALRFDTEGDIRLVNGRNPADEIIIRVAEPQEIQPRIYLPLMERTGTD